MESSTLSQLLKLPADDRAELAMALWESLSAPNAKRNLHLTDAQATEIDRRWAEHLANPGSAVRWSEVRRERLKNEDACSFFRPRGDADAFAPRRR